MNAYPTKLSQFKLTNDFVPCLLIKQKFKHYKQLALFIVLTKNIIKYILNLKSFVCKVHC